MRTVLAAIDESGTAGAVLDTARRVAALLDARVDVVHVRAPGASDLAEDVRSIAPEVQTLDGDVTPRLLDALAAGSIVVGVLGARRERGGPRPIGATAQVLLERSHRPMVVVPPGAASRGDRPVRRLLVPLEGDEATARPIGEVLVPLLDGRAELHLLHVVTRPGPPRTVERARWDLAAWSEEALGRFAPATHIDLRDGDVGARVVGIADDVDADLVVLSWSQDVAGPRAAVVRDVLRHSTRPVMLIPGHHARVGDPLPVARRER